MDKETLSNYGWIVICVLVLAVMLALATPFGSFVADAVKSTTKGLFDVNQSALNSTGLINIDDQSFDENGNGDQGGTNVYNELTTLTEKTWNGLTNFDGYRIWTDGTNVYYSKDTQQYILRGDTWEKYTWNGLTSFIGNMIWTDGTNIYYSRKAEQYVLNGDTWEKKTWSGLTNFDARQIWTDGENIYYSNTISGNGTTGNYVLENGVWKTLKWSAQNKVTQFCGSSVWTDGTNTYYSNTASGHGKTGDYVFYSASNTWDTKTWNITISDGSGVWTDGTNIYYSNQYVLHGDTWESKTWNGKTSFNSGYIWTDGTNYYYSSGSTHYVFS